MQFTFNKSAVILSAWWCLLQASACSAFQEARLSDDTNIDYLVPKLYSLLKVLINGGNWIYISNLNYLERNKSQSVQIHTNWKKYSAFLFRGLVFAQMDIVKKTTVVLTMLVWNTIKVFLKFPNFCYNRHANLKLQCYIPEKQQFLFI